MLRIFSLRPRCILTYAALAVVAVPALPMATYAEEWAPVAYISETVGAGANRLCVGVNALGDLACPTYAPSLTTAGHVSVTGNLSAARFIGDGSSLTGLPTQNVSVTTGVSGSLVYRDAFGSLVASSSLTISSTTGSVGIGAGAPANIGNNALYTTGSVFGSNGLLTNGNVTFNGNGALRWDNNSNTISGSSAQQHITFTTSGTEAMRIVSTGYVGIGTSAPSVGLHVSGNNGLTSSVYITRSGYGDLRLKGAGGNFMLPAIETTNSAGSTAGAITIDNNNGRYGLGFSPLFPSTTLHVAGSIRIASGGEACDANRTGAIRYTGGDFSVCRNGSAWETLTSIANNGTPDRIVSGTSSVYVANGGTVSVTVAGANVVNVGAGGLGTTAINVSGVARFDSATEIRGTISTSVVKFANNPPDSCTVGTLGSIKVVDGKIFTCRM